MEVWIIISVTIVLFVKEHEEEMLGILRHTSSVIDLNGYRDMEV